MAVIAGTALADVAIQTKSDVPLSLDCFAPLAMTARNMPMG